jgi:hypothetical protein
MLETHGWDDDELAPFLAAEDVYDEIWRCMTSSGAVGGALQPLDAPFSL